ncbi:MAG: hypothetical protein P8Y53_21190 [Pseudolabrys sp.]
MRAVAAHVPKQVVVAICDERLRFLKRLRTWPVFGRGWGRRVAEVKAVALAMATKAPRTAPKPAAPTPGRAVVAAHKGAQQTSAAGALAAGAVAAQQAHQSGHSRPLSRLSPSLRSRRRPALGLSGTGGSGTSRRSRRERPARRAAEHSRRSIPMWNKIKAWFKHSVTILWARAVALAGVALALAQSLLSDPNVNSAVHSILQPKLIPYYVIGIGIVTELARRRTAGKV